MGVLYWGWDLSVLLFLYWLESLVVGIVNIGYLAASNGTGKQRLRTLLFFIIHYGLFWIGHGVFLFVLLMPEINTYAQLGTEALIDNTQTIRYAFWGFVISHVLSALMYVNRLPREERLPPTYQMFTPYGRVFVMHIVILAGAYLTAEYANVTSVILLFAGLKILFELGTMAIGRSWRKRIEVSGELS